MTIDAFAELLEPADLHVAQRLSALGKEADDRVTLAVALAVRAVRGLSLIHISEPTRLSLVSRMPSSA